MNFTPTIKAKLYGERFSQASRQEIVEEVESWKVLQVTMFWENLREVKKAFQKEHKSLNFERFVFPTFETPYVEGDEYPYVAHKAFNFWEAGEKVLFLDETTFKKAIFIGRVNFKFTTFKEKTDLTHLLFKGDVNFANTRFEKRATFEKSQFRGETEFYHTQFLKKALFDQSGFHNRTVFHKVNFQDEACFSLVSSKYRITFFTCRAKRISFKYSRINHAYFVKNHFNYLNLHGVAIENPFFSDNIIDEAERETYAYIKHFFDNGDDYISANYYYAQEMQAYQKQLFPKSDASFFRKLYHWLNKPNLGDKLVFGFSKIASNFGQNIFLPLYWILFVGSMFVGINSPHNLLFILSFLVVFLLFIGGSTLLRKLFKQKQREDLVWILSYAAIASISVGITLFHGEFISNFAKVINPVQIIRGTNPYCHGIELSCLVLRIFIATMVYHFVIASKRGVKR